MFILVAMVTSVKTCFKNVSVLFMKGIHDLCSFETDQIGCKIINNSFSVSFQP